MRAAHHAGHVMARLRKPHGKIAADGARTKNANPHVPEILLKPPRDGSVSTTSRRGATADAICIAAIVERDGSTSTVAA